VPQRGHDYVCYGRACVTLLRSRALFRRFSSGYSTMKVRKRGARKGSTSDTDESAGAI